MESVKKSIDERAKHKREYDIRVNERQIQTTEGKVDTGKAVDASLVNTESIGTESKEQDTSSKSRNDAHADDEDIRPIYDEEPMAEVQTTVEINILCYCNHKHTDNLNSNNEERIYQNAEQCLDTSPKACNITDNQTTELQTISDMKRLKEFSSDAKSMPSDHNISELGMSATTAMNCQGYKAGPKVVPPADRQLHHDKIHKLLTRVLSIIHEILSEHPSDTYVLTMKMEILLEPASNKLLIHKDGDGDALFQLKSDSLPHDHAQTTKTYNKHRGMQNHESLRIKDKDFRTNSDIQDLPSKISSLSREIVSKLSR
ncbi:hypothetical protein Tco_0551501 [Tanacetum coccineum]